MSTSAFVAGHVRTPFTQARKGALASVRPDELGALAVKALLQRTGLVPLARIRSFAVSGLLEAA